MGKKHRSRSISRREFLISAASGLAGVAVACGGGGGNGSTPGSNEPNVQPGQAADMVLQNGKIITMDNDDTTSQAVAIKDGLIQKVGSNSQMSSVTGDSTQVVNLGGKAVTPGLIDAHNHFQIVGLMGTYFLPLLPQDVVTAEDLQDKLSDEISQKSAGEWVIGYFIVIEGVGLPNKNDLDPVSPNNPVFLIQQGGHYGTANSQALQISGITRNTPDPPGGVIGREANGEPNGIFYNHRAMDLIRRNMPLYTQDDVYNNVISTQQLFAGLGVTSFQDNNVRGVDTVGTYLDVGKQGKMYLRGAVYYTLEWPIDIDRALNQMEQYSDDYMRFAGYKFLLDGQLSMAYCHEPHNGERWNLPTWNPQTYKNAVRDLHDTGLQICVHCVGDAAVDLTLDAFEEAMNANPRSDPRHRIEHCIITKPESTQRIKDLGVVVSTQPQFIRLGGDWYVELLGEERGKRIIVTREWLENDIVVALSSDSPSTPWYTPMMTLIGSVMRATYSNQRYEPSQAMTMKEALYAYTMGSAYAAHEEAVKGSIEVGKMGDLAVWNLDPLTTSAQELWNNTMEMTIVGGKIVYQST